MTFYFDGKITINDSHYHPSGSTLSLTTGQMSYYVFPVVQVPLYTYFEQSQKVTIDYGLNRVLALDGANGTIDFENSIGFSGKQEIPTHLNKGGVELIGTSLPLFEGGYRLGAPPEGVYTKKGQTSLRIGDSFCQIPNRHLFYYTCTLNYEPEAPCPDELLDKGAIKGEFLQNIRPKVTTADELISILRQQCSDQGEDPLIPELWESLIKKATTI